MSLQDGGWSSETNFISRGLGLSATHPLGRERGLEMEFNHVATDVISCDYVVKPQ